MSDNPNVLCHVAKSAHAYLQRLQTSNDKWLATCSNFIVMSNDFLQFVEAYHNADAVAVEHGYLRHLPVWEALGQDKYV